MAISDPAGAAARLTVDLGAIVENWRRLGRLAPATAIGAAVKADAYGLGAAAVAPALARAGCRDFFVAHLEEGLVLRRLLPHPARIFVLNGVSAMAAAVMRQARLIPILNTPADIAHWQAEARRAGTPLDAGLHVDTGINRLGFPVAEFAALLAEPVRLAGIAVRLAMSHLACSDEPAHPLNHLQLERFRGAAEHPALAGVPRSLANSGGLLLGPEFAFDVARPGLALYGVEPRAPGRGMLLPVLGLEADILQLRDVDAPDTVGYGASHPVRGRRRVATVAVGYADGYMRAAGNCGAGLIGATEVPIIGRISMDLMTLDVTDVPIEQCRPGSAVTLIGNGLPLHRVAAAMDTIPYEVMTRLGSRFARHYVGGEA